MYRGWLKQVGAVVLVLGALLGAAAPARAGWAHYSTSPVYAFANGAVVPGALATLVREETGATMTLRTSGLKAGTAITIWWVVFNRPDQCTHGEGPFRCGPGDLLIMGGSPAVQSSLLYATGHVIGGDGRG